MGARRAWSSEAATGPNDQRTVVRPTLGELAEQWDELVAASALPSPFLRSWWLEAVAGPGATFVLVLRGDRLLGGLALEVRRRLGVEWLVAMGDGPLAPDHLDLVARPGDAGVVAHAIGRWLRRPGARVVDVAGVVADHQLGRALGPPLRATQVEVAPWMRLDEDFTSHLQRLPPIMRNSVRRSTKRLAKQELSFERVAADRAGAALLRLKELHGAQWGHDGFLGAFSAFERAATTGINRDEVVLLQLAVAGEVVAVDVAFTVRGRMSYYQGGRDTSPEWAGAGTVLMARGIEWACHQRFSEVDFLRGDEPYKRYWADEERPVLRLRAPFGWSARVVLRALESRQAVRSHRLVGRVRRIVDGAGKALARR